MDIISLLTSFNIISLIAFFITLGFISYQILLLRRETRARRGKLIVPDFKENTPQTGARFTKLLVTDEKGTAFKKQSTMPLFIGILLLLVFSGILLFNIFNRRPATNATSAITPTPFVNLIVSKGIKLYNQNWVALSDSDAAKLQPGQTIIVAIQTVPGADIDRARIRVNKSIWEIGDITLDFNQVNQIYYKSFTIATGAATLKVEAQLHSKTDGWLGD